MHLTGHFHNCLSHIWMDPECYRNPERSVSRTQSRRCLRMPDVLQKMYNYNYTCSLVACWGPLQGLVPVYPPWVLSATVFHPHTLLSSTKENGYSVLEDDILWNQRAAPDFAWSASAHLHTLWCSLKRCRTALSALSHQCQLCSLQRRDRHHQQQQKQYQH